MDPPTPIEKVEENKKYKVKENDNEYEISFYLTKININFEVQKIGAIIPEIYMNSFDLNALNNLCKIFNLCNSCKDAFEYINEIFKQNKVSLKNLNVKINLVLKVQKLMKEEDITLSLFNKK